MHRRNDISRALLEFSLYLLVMNLFASNNRESSRALLKICLKSEHAYLIRTIYVHHLGSPAYLGLPQRLFR